MLNEIRWKISKRVLKMLCYLIPKNVKFSMNFVKTREGVITTQEILDINSPDVSGGKNAR